MHELWTILIVNMMYTRSQNYTNMIIGKQNTMFEVVLVVLLLLLLSFDVFGLTSTHPSLFLGQVVSSNIHKCQLVKHVIWMK